MNWLSIFLGLPGRDTPFKANQDRAPVTGIFIYRFKTCLKRVTEIGLPFQSKIFTCPAGRGAIARKEPLEFTTIMRPEAGILRSSYHRYRARSALFTSNRAAAPIIAISPPGSSCEASMCRFNPDAVSGSNFKWSEPPLATRQRACTVREYIARSRNNVLRSVPGG